MDDVLIADAIERMLNGEMSEQEKNFFDELRKNDPELDQTVVESLFFYNQLEKYGRDKQIRNTIGEVAKQYQHETAVVPVKPKGKLVSFYQKYRRTVGVAAAIAGAVSLFVAGLVSSASKEQPNLTPLVKKINEQESKTRQIEHKLNQLEASTQAPNMTPASVAPPRLVEPKFRASGFMVDVKDNLIFTNAHVVSQAANRLIVENNNGQQFKAKTVYVNKDNDIAILKIDDASFKTLAPLPYNIRKGNAELGEEVFMLGFPKQEIVYNEGYISARNGFNMDTIYCQLSTAANEGSSGSPVVSKNGDLIGIISSKETNAQGVIFAVKAANIYRALSAFKGDSAAKVAQTLTKNQLRGQDRVAQIKRMQDYVFMIKGN